MALITEDDLDEYLGEGLVTVYKRGSATVVADKIAIGEDRMRSAGLNVFTAASWDAMTSATLPPEAKQYLVWDVGALLSSGSNTKDFVQRNADEAAKWRSWLAADKVRCFDSVLTKASGSAGSDRVRIASPTRNELDVTNTASRLYAVDPPL